MAEQKGTNLGAVYAQPGTFASSPKFKGKRYSSVDFLTPTVLAVGDVWRLARVPSHAVLKEVEWALPVVMADGPVKLGFYEADGEAVGSADQLQASQVLTGAVTAYTEVRDAADVFSQNQQFVWELLGYTQDPGLYFDVAFTVITAPVTSPNPIYLKVEYAA